MQYSYFNIKENDFHIYEDQRMFAADVIMIDANDAGILFTNRSRMQDMFDAWQQTGIQLYLKINSQESKRSLKAIDLVDAHYLSGFYLIGANKHILRDVSLKARAYEAAHHLPYQSLNVIVAIDNATSLHHIRYLVKHPRVKKLMISPVLATMYPRLYTNATRYARLYHKILIDPAQLTEDVAMLQNMNQSLHPSLSQVKDAQETIDLLIKSSEKEQNQRLQQLPILETIETLNLAKKLHMIDEVPQIFIEQHKRKLKLHEKDTRVRKFYTLGEEISNAITHGVGILLALVMLIVLIFKADQPYELQSYLIFSLSAFILYTMSTLYHSLPLGHKAKQIFQRFDHMTIYILIAGTYTPFSLLAIGGAIGIWVCIGLWIAGCIGLLLNLFAFGRFRILHMTLYVAMGWVAIFFMPQIIQNIQLGGILLLLMGGISYTFGILFYALKLFKFTHMVWHLFTLGGTLLHFFALLFFV